MRTLSRLLALFLLVPVVELVLLVWLGGRIGFLPTVGLVALTAVAGAYLARREGTGVIRRFREKLGYGAVPGRELLDGLIVLVSGVLLLTPGVLTDLVGLVGLVPATRAAIRGWMEAGFGRAVLEGRVHVSGRGADFGGPFGHPVEDAEVVEPEPSAGTDRGRLAGG